jgi:branched-chain amino acid aminotransferase
VQVGTTFGLMSFFSSQDGNFRLFRPDCNMDRMNDSMQRLCMPGFDGEQWTECIKELVKLEKDW